MMIVVACGSRTWRDVAVVNDRIGQLPLGTILIQGGASGADRMVRDAARAANLHCAEMPALWGNGRRAGPMRNRAMLDLRPDLVLAFQVGQSRGTQHTIDEAHRRGIPVEVVAASSCARGDGFDIVR